MKHVLSKIGDPIPEEDLDEFFKYLEDGTGYTRIEDIVNLLGP